SRSSTSAASALFTCWAYPKRPAAGIWSASTKIMRSCLLDILDVIVIFLFRSPPLTIPTAGTSIWFLCTKAVTASLQQDTVTYACKALPKRECVMPALPLHGVLEPLELRALRRGERGVHAILPL